MDLPLALMLVDLEPKKVISGDFIYTDAPFTLLIQLFQLVLVVPGQMQWLLCMVVPDKPYTTYLLPYLSARRWDNFSHRLDPLSGPHSILLTHHIRIIITPYNSDYHHCTNGSLQLDDSVYPIIYLS